MNLELLWGYREQLLSGAGLSFALALGSLVLALVFGIGACLGSLSGRRWLRWPANFYITVVRGIPDLVQLFLLYYGGQYLLNYLHEQRSWPQLEMTPFLTGVIAIGFISGAYMAEAFRGGFLAIPKGQVEAARAFGMGPGTIFWRIQRPQMLRYALPALGNNWLVLMKNTSLVSIIGLKDLVFVASSASRAMQRKDIYAAFWFYGAIAVFFLLLTSLSILLLRRLERRYGLGFNPTGVAHAG